MQLKKIYLLALPLMLAACSNDNEPGASQNDGESIEVQVRATVAGQSRSRASFGLDRSLAEGAVMAYHVYNAVDNTLLGSNERTVLADGSLSDAPNAIYYPINGDAVDVYAIATKLSPNFGGGFEFYPIPGHAPQRYFVSDATDTDGYACGDLCYAVSKGNKASREPINLEFHHLMSKVEVVVTEGSGDADFLTNATRTLDITNTKTAYTFVLDADAPTAIITPEDGSEGPIAMQAAVGEVNEAIVVPQTVAAGTALLKFTADGGEWTYKPTADITFESGKRYCFNLTLSQNELTVTYTVADWADGSDFTDEVTPEIPSFSDSRAVDMGNGIYWANTNALEADVIDNLNWGDWVGWRVPTQQEYIDLVNACEIAYSGNDVIFTSLTTGNTLTIYGYGLFATSTPHERYEVAYMAFVAAQDVYGSWYNTYIPSTSTVNVRLVHDK